jgi:hypothetical protein
MMNNSIGFQHFPTIMERQVSTESTKQIEVVKHSATTALERALNKERKALLKNKKPKSTNSVSDDMQGQEMLWMENQVVETDTKKAGLFRSFRPVPVTTKSPAKPQIVLVEQEDEATLFSKRQESAQKADYARRLLHAALSRDPLEQTEFGGKSHEVLLTDAFQAAADSRRLVEHETNEEELSRSASRGEQEVREAWKIQEESILLPPSQRPKRVVVAVPKTGTCDDDDTPPSAMVSPPKDPEPSKGSTLLHGMANAANEALRPFQEHAEEARRQLESMLPGFLVNVFSSDDEEEQAAIKSKDEDVSLQERDTFEKMKMKEIEEEEDEEKVSVLSAGTLRDKEIVRVVLDQQRLPAFSPRVSPPLLTESVDQIDSPHMAVSATISTLGFDNTFEEKTLTNDKNPIPPDLGRVISVSSLNEFMDGDGNDADEDARKRKKMQKAKSVPAVIASKPMHETTKPPQNKPIFRGIMHRKKKKAPSTTELGTAVGVASSKKKISLSRKKRTMDQGIVADEERVKDDDELMYRDNIQKTEDAIKEAMMKADMGSNSASINGLKQGPASPSFIAAPVIANGLMTPQSWGTLAAGGSLDDILHEGDKNPTELSAKEAPVSVDQLPKESGTTRKFGFFQKLRGKNKDRGVTASVVAAIVESSEAAPEKVTNVVSHPKVAVPFSPAKKQVSDQAVPIDQEIPLIRSNDSRQEIPLIRSDDSRPDMGDKYTALMDDEIDKAADDAKQRLQNKAPIVSDVDMMLTNEPNVFLSEIRNVFSMDCGDAKDVEGVAVFGKVEVGDDENAHTEETLLNRESVIKAIHTPRHETTIPATKNPMKRSTSTHGPEGLTASASFMEELAEVKKLQTSTKVVNTPTKTKYARFWGRPKLAFSKGSKTNTVLAEANTNAEPFATMRISI